MLLTRDVNVDWNQVPDPSSGKLLPGFIQMVIKDYEEKMTNAEGMDKEGNPKVAKYMLVCHLEAVAPEEVAGMTRDEYFVLGSNDDPLMSKSDTFYKRENYGASGLKGMLGAAQVPWSSSLLATLNSSIGAMFLLGVTHKMEKRRDNNEEFVGVKTGRTFRIGEKIPQIIPCALPACEDCKALRGVVSPVPSVGASTAPPTVPPVAPPMAPPASGPRVNPVAPAVLSPLPAAPAIPTTPTAPAPGVMPSLLPTPSMPSVSPAGGGVPGGVNAPPAVTVPQGTMPAGPGAPSTAQVEAAQAVAGVQPATPPVTPPLPEGHVRCKICQVWTGPAAEYGAHVAVCAAQVAQQAMTGFKQEV